VSDAERILEERARLYARPIAPDRAETTIALVRFEIGNERFAIEAAFVQRIVALPRVTPLPGTPPHLAGIANVLRQLLPVFDLGRILGIPPAGDAGELVVLGRVGPEFGILAGAVTDLVPLDTVPRGGKGDSRAIVQRVLADGRSLIDGAALLDDPRLVVGPVAAHSTVEEVSP
jgi:purine-binding chemotaxis protein CheW